MTWFVTYKFYNGSEWVKTNQYVEATSPELAKAKVATILTETGYKFEIISARMVGEGR